MVFTYRVTAVCLQSLWLFTGSADEISTVRKSVILRDTRAQPLSVRRKSRGVEPVIALN